MGMGKQTSIPCDSEVRDRLANDKAEDVSWSAFLSKLHSDGKILTEGKTQHSEYDTDDIEDRLDRLEDMTKEATNAAQSAEHAIEDLSR